MNKKQLFPEHGYQYVNEQNIQLYKEPKEMTEVYTKSAQESRVVDLPEPEISIETGKSESENNDTSREELAAAYLAAFFAGKITQSALSSFLELSNITTQVKLPTSFDGLIGILIGNKNLKTYKKTFYCSSCLKLLTNVSSKLDRMCKVCSKKYIM
jgi:hypothetical protein